ncbi:Signal peptide peptidase-like 2A [Bagarius yarrelli]|uniref:Signal peptide peptidase-like 2A n=1 Tax=Bagarius yarrelli TaxID=175774 RepID=A0A556VUE4_BAGYA|nr:Signal peptide peptidase-like 2A [Bagarius yarrelli]
MKVGDGARLLLLRELPPRESRGLTHALLYPLCAPDWLFKQRHNSNCGGNLKTGSGSFNYLIKQHPYSDKTRLSDRGFAGGEPVANPIAEWAGLTGIVSVLQSERSDSHSYFIGSLIRFIRYLTGIFKPNVTEMTAKWLIILAATLLFCQSECHEAVLHVSDWALNKDYCLVYNASWSNLSTSLSDAVTPSANNSEYDNMTIPLALMRYRDFLDVQKVFNDEVEVQLYAPTTPEFDASILIMLAIAVFTVAMGGFWSGAAEKERQSVTALSAADERSDSGDLTLYSPLKVLLFVVLMCVMLVLMYFFYRYLGLLVAYCHRFDVWIGSSNRIYFISCAVAYTLGLVLTFVVMLLSRMGQPALLYLVPFTLLTSGLLAWKRREFKQFWAGTTYQVLLWPSYPAACWIHCESGDEVLGCEAGRGGGVRTELQGGARRMECGEAHGAKRH